jgi:ABC-type glycerol-3-phosphate transport system substrate-binding protein
VAALDMWVNVALRQQAAPTTQPEAWRAITGGGFRNGLAAMQFLSSQDAGQLKVDIKDFQWTTAPMPRKVKQGAHFFSGGWFVTRAAREKDAAAEFLRLANLPEHVVQWDIGMSSMTPRKSAAARKEWEEHLRAEPRLAVYNDTTRYMRSYPALPGWTEASNGLEGIGQALIDAVQGKFPPRQALEEVARRADAIIAQQAR